MNKKGALAEKMGFYIAYIFIFSFAILFAAGFIARTSVDFDSEGVEDSIVATRILSCFSGEEFGVIDRGKVNEENLRGCFDGDKYSLNVKVNKIVDKEIVEHKTLTPFGQIDNPRIVKRYVIFENERGLLEIKYKKNVA